MLHDAFNVFFNGSPSINVEVWLGIIHSVTRGCFIFGNESSRGIFDSCKLFFNFNPIWASPQLNGLHRDKQIALLMLHD